MGMIQQIINDAKAMEAETIRAEEDAQKAEEGLRAKSEHGSPRTQGATNRGRPPAHQERRPDALARGGAAAPAQSCQLAAPSADLGGQ